MNPDSVKKQLVDGLKWLGVTVAGIVVAAVIKGEQLKGLTTLGRLRVILLLKIPFWIVLPLGVFAAWAAWNAYSLWRHRRFIEMRLKVNEMRHVLVAVLKEDKAKLEEQLAAFDKKPKIREVGATNYYFVDDNGPYCQRCYDLNQRLVKLTPQLRIGGGTGRRCNVCNDTFLEVRPLPSPAERFRSRNYWE